MVKIKVILKILFLLIMSVACLTAFPQRGFSGESKWSRVNIPSNGVSGQWVLAEGSDLHSLALASDGTIYCSANPDTTPYRLFKSTDGGGSWIYTGRVEDTIVDIALIPDDPNLVYYATIDTVFKSVDAGGRFEPLAGNPGGSGTGNIQITSLDVISNNGINYVAVSVRDTDPTQYGGVYVLDESQTAAWRDCDIGLYDILKIAFSPNFAQDRQLIAIGTNEQDTVISSGSLEGGWGLDIGQARLPGVIPLTADIAFPDDYESAVISGKNIQFISLNTGNGQGGIYCLRGQAAPALSTITELEVVGSSPIDISSVAVSGNGSEAKLLVISAESSQTYFSEDAGITWDNSAKPPSGDSGTGVLIADDFTTTGRAFAITTGTESAFSVSRDQGATWSQTGLIDTRISTILDLAVSPDFARDASLFLLTADIQNGLWHSSDGGFYWQRIYNTVPAQTDRINLVLLSPEYSEKGEVLLAGTSGGLPVIWKSEDNGRSFSQYASVDPDTGDPVNIDTWILSPGNILFVGSFDGNHGMVYQTGPDSLAYVDKGVAGSQIINSLSLSPNYINDHTILAGNTYGSVFYSLDNGLVFEPLPLDVAEPPLSGNISVAFDVNYMNNNTVYAGDDTAGYGLYRFVIGESIYWESIDRNLPDKARIGAIEVSDEGVLYALNLQPVENAGTKGGMERSLNATASTPDFMTVISGLEDGISLKKLWFQENNLWTVDTLNNKLLTYTDALVSPITLISPADDAAGVKADNITLVWQAVDGAAVYHWQISKAADFSTISDKYQGNTASSQVILNNLDEDTNYYWRIRAVEPVVSPWSSIWSFNTLKLDAPSLSQPGSSATTSIEPLFRWSVSEGAEQYQLLVSLDDQFNDLAINRLCNANVWQCNTALQNDTSYYWKVKAIKGEISSEWSAVNIFTTVAGQTPTATPTPTSTATSTPTPPLELDAPTLSKPKSGSTCSVRPLFEWSVCAGAEQYELIASQNDNFTNLAVDKSGDNACNSNVWACDIELEHNNSYYWKVRAKNAGTLSNWSAVNLFTTEAAAAPSPTPGLNAPRPSAPVSSTSAAIEPVFRWSAVEGADQYELVVSQTDTFANLVIDEICYANTWVCEITLAYQTAYYWKVRAIKGELQSDWSDVGAFTTKVEPSNSSSGGADPPARTTLPGPTLIPTPTSTPSITQLPATTVISVAPTNTPTSLAPPITTGVSAVPASTAKAASSANGSSATATPALGPEAAGTKPENPVNSPNPILFVMVGGLAVLTAITTGVTIFLLKKGK